MFGPGFSHIIARVQFVVRARATLQEASGGPASTFDTNGERTAARSSRRAVLESGSFKVSFSRSSRPLTTMDPPLEIQRNHGRQRVAPRVV